jgi:hypothetical protein
METNFRRLMNQQVVDVRNAVSLLLGKMVNPCHGAILGDAEDK